MKTRLHEALEERGISQGELARRLDMDKGYVSKVVRGITRPGVDRAVAFADVLQLSVEELFGEAA